MQREVDKRDSLQSLSCKKSEATDLPLSRNIFSGSHHCTLHEANILSKSTTTKTCQNVLFWQMSRRHTSQLSQILRATELILMNPTKEQAVRSGIPEISQITCKLTLLASFLWERVVGVYLSVGSSFSGRERRWLLASTPRSVKTFWWRVNPAWWSPHGRVDLLEVMQIAWWSGGKT